MTPRPKPVKVVIWDLDNTLWEGVLLEDGPGVRVRPEMVDFIRAADERGVLHAISSRNDAEAAGALLEEHGLRDLFVAEQIHWGAKSASIGRIAEELNLGTDSFVFVDDRPFEREEVASVHPEVQCVDAVVDDITAVVRLDDLPITPESRSRRTMVHAESARKEDRARFDGPDDAFLATLDMVMEIRQARPDDLVRAEELTERTNQLNSTGVTYSIADLERMGASDDHLVLMATLEDRYGGHGKIGLAVISKDAGVWTLKLLLTSCRVMACGAGSILLNAIMRGARDAGAQLQAHFLPTGRNRMMQVAYRFGGFRTIDTDGELQVLGADLSSLQEPPRYVDLRETWRD